MISALTPQVNAFHYSCIIRPTTVTTVCRHHIFMPVTFSVFSDPELSPLSLIFQRE